MGATGGVGFTWTFIVCTTLLVSAYSAHLEGEQVLITRDLCGKTLDAGQDDGQWKRLAFPPNGTCFTSCLITFRMMDIKPLASDICVDYSRMELHGSDTKILINRDARSTLAWEILNENRYPLVERFMRKRLCINKKEEMVFKLRTDCERALHEAFVGWMYVFVQSSTAGDIYFIDGKARHAHTMSRQGQPIVTIRSHVWRDGPDSQTSMFRLSASIIESTRPYLLCLEISPHVRPHVPVDVVVKVFRGFRHKDTSSFRPYMVLKGGLLVVSERQQCYFLEVSHELLITVERGGNTYLDGNWTETKLLFQFAIGLNNMGDCIYKHDSPCIIPTTPPPTTEEPPTEDDSFWSQEATTAIAATGGTLAGLVLLYCCCCRNDTCSDICSEESPENEEEDRNGTNDNTQPQPPSADAYPMLPRAMPTAPQWNDGDEGRPLDGFSNVSAPPSDTDRGPAKGEGCPPSYHDLFPDERRKFVHFKA